MAFADWECLSDKLKDNKLIAASYRGKGKRTKQTYFLHLLSYMNRKDSFIGLIENTETKKAVLGILVKKQENAYDWFNFVLDADPASGEALNLKILMHQPGLMRFNLIKDADGDVKLVATSLRSGVAAEVAEFNEVRNSLLSPNLTEGKTKKEKGELYITAQEQSDLYTAQYVANLENGAQQQLIARSYLPGIYTFHFIESTGYTDSIESSIKYIGVSIYGYSGFLNLPWEWTGALPSRVFLFDVQNNFLVTEPRILKHED